jgi:hypothetical protein
MFRSYNSGTLFAIKGQAQQCHCLPISFLRRICIVFIAVVDGHGLRKGEFLIFRGNLHKRYHRVCLLHMSKESEQDFTRFSRIGYKGFRVIARVPYGIVVL